MSHTNRKGRKQGSPSFCSFCGSEGHNATKGVCSATSLAAKLVLEDGLTQAEASRQSGADPTSLSRFLHKTAELREKVSAYKEQVRATVSSAASRARAERGLTLQAMADSLGVALATYYAWERGVRIPHDVDGVLAKLEVTK